MGRKPTQYLTGLVALAVLGAAGWVLSEKLSDLQFDQIMERLHATALADVGLSLLFTVGAYLVLTVYDSTAFAYIKRPMRFMRVMYVSFIAYAFSHTLGFGAVSGGSVRYRFYTRWGVSAYDIATVLIFGGMAYVLGIVAVAGFIVFINADDLARAVDAPIWASHLAGAVAVIVGSSYLIWSIIGKPSFVLKGRRFYPPSLKIGLTQVASACLEWGFASAALYFLLPQGLGVSYWGFIGIYVIGYIAGMMSQAPGGIGVFEAALLLLLPETAPKDAVLAAMLVYRALYFLLPFIIALTMMGCSEARGAARAARKGVIIKRRKDRAIEGK
jgi:uncharacterized membrane protein YbhN (UPF0104 family)